MGIIHIVLFTWKPDTSKKTIEEAFTKLQTLEQDCIHPTSAKPYIKSLKSGENNSPEGLADPFTHGFVVEFENAEDRDYYCNKDPAHAEFKKYIGALLAGIKVFDFEPGKF